MAQLLLLGSKKAKLARDKDDKRSGQRAYWRRIPLVVVTPLLVFSGLLVLTAVTGQSQKLFEEIGEWLHSRAAKLEAKQTELTRHVDRECSKRLSKKEAVVRALDGIVDRDVLIFTIGILFRNRTPP
jgi:hypothetical protein